MGEKKVKWKKDCGHNPDYCAAGGNRRDCVHTDTGTAESEFLQGIHSDGGEVC